MSRKRRRSNPKGKSQRVTVSIGSKPKPPKKPTLDTKLDLEGLQPSFSPDILRARLAELPPLPLLKQAPTPPVIPDELLTRASPSIADLPAWQDNSQAFNATYRYGIVYGLVAGTSALALGFILAILGLAQAIDFGFEGAETIVRLKTASPGALFAIVGLVIILWFKPKLSRKSVSTQHTGGGRTSYRREESTTAGARLAR